MLLRPVESAQFTSNRYTERLAELVTVPSVGSVGDSFNSSVAEGHRPLQERADPRTLPRSLGQSPPPDALVVHPARRQRCRRVFEKTDLSTATILIGN